MLNGCPERYSNRRLVQQGGCHLTFDTWGEKPGLMAVAGIGEMPKSQRAADGTAATYLAQAANRNRLDAGSSKQAHRHVFPFVSGKGLIVRPAFHLQIGNDVLPGRRRCLIAPELLNFHYPGQVMPQFAVLHAEGRTPGKFIQPAMHLFKRLAKEPDRFFAVFLKGRHCFSL